MTKQEVSRLNELEKRIKEIAKEFGLLTTDTIFEIVPAQRVLEGMSYMFPTNFSHWSFGRDFERHRTIYEHTGAGIPYEQVWNFDVPRAFLVETNPFVLNVLVIAHVYGHVDYFLGNRYLQHGRSFSDTATEAKRAADRFEKYERRYGTEVEKIIDAGMSISRHQHPDPFFEEQDEEMIRQRLLALAHAKLEYYDELKKPDTKEEIEKIERELHRLTNKTPPEPVYDILNYIIKKSPRPLRPWMVDVLTVIRNQARCLAPNYRTKMLDEGWATYWHVKIMRRLFEERLLDDREHGVYDTFHSGVTESRKRSFNWYRVGWKIFEYIEERWDKGQFGQTYEEERNPFKRSEWDTKTGLGREKIFEVRSFYTDRMAVEEFFTDEFIKEQELYVYASAETRDGEIIDVVINNDPKEIRPLIKSSMVFYGIPLIVVENGNRNGAQHLHLKHIYTGYELDPVYRNATLTKILHLWGKKVFLECREGDKEKLFIADYDGKKNNIKINVQS